MTGASGESLAGRHRCGAQQAKHRDFESGASPTENAESTLQTDLLQLALLPGIGPRTLTALLTQFGSATEVLHASREQLATVPGVGEKTIATIATASDYVDVAAVVKWCEDHDVQIITQRSTAYPSPLLQLDDAPPVIFLRGQWNDRDRLAVSIVGTRHATPDGRKHAAHFASMLARVGITVVSGLARGIDAAAHQGALDAGGRTLAVLGSGLGSLYPPEHHELAEAIYDQGALLSEYAPQSRPRSGMFPQRNRLIASLSVACLVIEAPERSGALITARLAAEQNKDVMAVPGPIHRRTSRGCHALIRDGATLVQSVDDVLEQLGPLAQPVSDADGHEVHSAAELTLNEIERRVLAAIDTKSMLIDRVIEATGLPAQRVLAVISVLEMKRLVSRQAGQYLRRL